MKIQTLILAACSGIMVGMLMIIPFSKPHWKIIEHGAAHYDGKTGQFTWHDEVKP